MGIQRDNPILGDIGNDFHADGGMNRDDLPKFIIRTFSETAMRAKGRLGEEGGGDWRDFFRFRATTTSEFLFEIEVMPQFREIIDPLI